MEQARQYLEVVRDTHNIWLQNMSELGVPGLALIVCVALCAVGLGLAVRIRARGPASAGAAAAFTGVMLVYLLHASVDWMWESTAVTVLALAGVTSLGARLSTESLRLSVPIRAVLVAIAAGAAIVQLPGILSTSDLRRSRAAERAGDAGAALALARDAVSAEPWSASAHEQQALVLEAEGQLLQRASPGVAGGLPRAEQLRPLPDPVTDRNRARRAGRRRR